MENEIVAVSIPIALFVGIAVVLCAYFYLDHRTKRAVQETVRTAIEQGQQLTPEILERLGQPLQLPRSDLHRGVILIAAGLGLAAFGALADEENVIRPLIAAGSLPFLIGIAYLGLWKFGKSE